MGRPEQPDLGPIDAVRAFRLDGRVAVVTGASAGLGERFARVLSGAGARVVLAARRIDRLEALAAELPGSIAVRCDVTDEADRHRLVETAQQRLGGIDVLVNNAGTARALASVGERPEALRAVLEINVVAVFDLCRLVGRLMLERGRGSIVNVASMYAVVSPRPTNPLLSYAASKAAVAMLSRHLAVEWAARGVRVNALAPGYFRSEMTAGLFDDDALRSEIVEGPSPMGRGGRPDELDGALLLLAGDAGSFITGQVLVVDGGWSAT
jgi:NAD(P)-dependent dehydrogenase (short-subunit alcohol dehydrogenase family)